MRIRIEWSKDDDAFLAWEESMLSAKTHGATPQKALDELMLLLAEMGMDAIHAEKDTTA